MRNRKSRVPLDPCRTLGRRHSLSLSRGDAKHLRETGGEFDMLDFAGYGSEPPFAAITTSAEAGSLVRAVSLCGMVSVFDISTVDVPGY
jgi:hypothetical protein